MSDQYPMRINKYLAHKGFATRREGDVLVESGRVTINGRTAALGDKVMESDKVEVRTVQRSYTYFAYNKPIGVITHTPQFGEKDIRTASKLHDVFPIGRLDKRSHGLIILTDDGRVTERLLSPKSDHEKEYHVTTRDPLPDDFKKKMEQGVNIEGYVTKKCRVEVTGSKKFTIIITEGKKHQIRRMCMALGVTVDDLERVRVMNVKLGDLKLGAYRQLKGEELARFLKSLQLL